MGKSPLLMWKVSMWIMVKTCVLYKSDKIHLFLKFIQTDGISVFLHNYSKSDCHKFKNFKKLQLYIWHFSPYYRNLRRCISSCTCICWLFHFVCSAYFSLYKQRFTAFNLSLVGTFVLTLYGWYCPNIFHAKTGSSFEALIFQCSFDICVSFLCFSPMKDFLWFEYLSWNFVFDMS